MSLKITESIPFVGGIFDSTQTNANDNLIISPTWFNDYITIKLTHTNWMGISAMRIDSKVGHDVLGNATWVPPPSGGGSLSDISPGEFTSSSSYTNNHVDPRGTADSHWCDGTAENLLFYYKPVNPVNFEQIYFEQNDGYSGAPTVNYVYLYDNGKELELDGDISTINTPRNTVSTTVYGYFYGDGWWATPYLDISTIGTIGSHQINWVVSGPSGTMNIQTRVSLDGGSTVTSWTTSSNGDPIPNLPVGTDVSNGILQLCPMLYAPSSRMATPEMADLSVTMHSTDGITDNAGLSVSDSRNSHSVQAGIQEDFGGNLTEQPAINAQTTDHGDTSTYTIDNEVLVNLERGHGDGWSGAVIPWSGTVDGTVSPEDTATYAVSNEVEESTIQTSDVWQLSPVEQALINATVSPVETLTLVLTEPAANIIGAGGERISVPYDLSSLDDVSYGLVEWREDTKGQLISVDTSYTLDGGITWSDWEVCTNKGQVPSLSSISDTTGVKVKVRQILISKDNATSPILYALNIRFFSSTERAVTEPGADSTAHGTANDVTTGNGRAVEEIGADATGNNTANDVLTGNGRAVEESGADVTGNNTANDVLTGGDRAVAEDGATNDSAFRHTDDLSMIDGGKIYAGSSIQIGNLDGISDYCKIDKGDIKFFQYLGGSHRLTKSLKRMEVGVCENAQYTTLSGYWATTPNIIVSPHSLQTYDGSYSSQSQKLECQPIEPENLGGGQFRFQPKANLVLSSGAGSFSIGTWGSMIKHPDWCHFPYTIPQSGVKGIAVSLLIKGYYYTYQYDKVYFGWVDLKAWLRVKDDSGWSNWIASGELRVAKGETKSVVVSAGTTGYSNISEVEVGVNYQPSYGYDMEVRFNAQEWDMQCGLDSYTAYFAANQVLSSGTLNYMAISQ